jgi:hypothetical protein
MQAGGGGGGWGWGGGGANAPPVPPCAHPPPHEITFCPLPPRKSPFFLNLYKQTSEE